ncbi:cation diffusion facilitator CzcD-associated flavoprotein CzcO [Microbacterium endophyticum]|uniref:Cation diffusion facilitator CzcD-associated flavoprotein CzcO n=1 Tax=Microbacterium endophyticum TaxID=1526412 RepID=A0A7W4YMR2_9MICO|nr:NAD(P)/FAD-dependent oxidoreductase [Microbacterium endophyticum]MBB2975759.1 cation diffusion facilitator CzcD-associated flavoprotein CzcO [Microbacterium endophyticum]NIK36242.1 cation diffusion facilitator CzcD-associated flavoprotein CzcO [Microbacterium endophyticum]
MSAPHAAMTVDELIVGAGFAGIGMALQLRRAGRNNFAIIERGASVGGTWRDNTYPGVACDVPSHLYGFASHPNPEWSALFATGDEIHGYLQKVVRDERLDEQLLLNTTLTSARWDAARSLWVVSTSGDAPGVIEAHALVLACGRLTEPVIPDIPGLETFTGPLFHSARWDHSAELAGKRVAVVGTGASAVQLVPELAGTAAHVTVFQRTAPWIVPRDARRYSAEELATFRDDPKALARLREELYSEGEARYAARSGDAAAAADATALADAHREKHVADPALRAALRPSYAFGCKRVLLSDDYYPAVASDAVTVEASALESVSGRTLVAASGERYDADIVVLATGFAAAQQPYAHLITGETGQTLAEHWSSGMTSFASTVVSGFPQLFVLNGPNASLGHNSSVLMAEAQAEYVTQCLDRAPALGGIVRVRPEAETTYSAEIDAAAAPTPWLGGGCHNWYVDDRSGRLTLLWPGTVQAFRDMLAATTGSEFFSTDVYSPPASIGAS